MVRLPRHVTRPARRPRTAAPAAIAFPLLTRNRYISDGEHRRGCLRRGPGYRNSDQAQLGDDAVLAVNEQANALGRGRRQLRLHRRAGASRCDGDTIAKEELGERALNRVRRLLRLAKQRRRRSTRRYHFHTRATISRWPASPTAVPRQPWSCAREEPAYAVPARRSDAAPRRSELRGSGSRALR